MNQQMTHERCSEALRDYVRGDLDAPQAAAVRAHLATCDACSAEHRALLALEREVDPLSSEERASLRRRVLTELGGSAPPHERPARGSAGVRRAPDVGARLGGLLSAAALLLIVAVGLVWVGSNLGGSDEGAESGAAMEAGAPEAAPEIADADVPFRARFERDAGSISTQDLDRLGRRGFSGALAAVTARSQAQDSLETSEGADRSGEPGRVGDRFTLDNASEVEQLQDPLLDRLARKAPGEAETIRACARSVLDQGFEAVPVYGAFATLDGQPVLVLGFRMRGDRDALDRFMVWVWPRGSCDMATEFRSGRIAR